MLDTVTSRLSGLAGRTVYFMPFSRKTYVDTQVLSQSQDLHKECVIHRGVLVAQPEHILSFRLMGIERSTLGDAVGPKLLEAQHWLDINARDVLDESDEILDVK